MAKVSIQLVIHNDDKIKAYLPYVFLSLKQQTFEDWDLIIVSNNAGEELLSVVEQQATFTGKEFKIIKNDENLGFAGGHNTAFTHSNSEYFLLLNPDMYIMPAVLQDMVDFMDSIADASAVSPRLMRWDFDKVLEQAPALPLAQKAKVGFTDFIDAIGIRLYKNRRALEWLTRHEWTIDTPNEDVQKLIKKDMVEVFAVSGAFVLYRRSAVEKLVLHDGSLFDATYGSYKEDLDLGYRMRNAGHTSYVLLKDVVYHDRTGAGPKQESDFAAAKNKKEQSFYVRFHSYKNHIRTLLKNEYWQNIARDFFAIFWFELKKFGFLLLFHPVVLFKGWFEILKEFGYLRKSRKAILDSRTMHWKGIRRWFL